MSYDLYITPKKFDLQAMFEWLGWRNHYEQGGSQVRYSNDDTGVYFSFDFYDDPAQEEGEAQRQPHIVFNLNYHRPHVFGLEAEPEVAAFLKQFESAIDDPQMEGMGEGPYSREGFLRAWNAGNRFGFQAVGSSSEPPPWGADPAVIEAIWKWNYERAALQKTAGDQVFVPRISWFLPAGADAPVAACTWTEHVPTMIPESLVTHVALVRQPRQGIMGMLGLSRGGQPKFELKLAGVKGVTHMPGMDHGEAHGNHVAYTSRIATPETQKLFSGAWPPGAASIVAAEHVCGADLVALMKKA